MALLAWYLAFMIGGDVVVYFIGLFVEMG